MAEYFLAPSLVGFRSSINGAFPNRDKSSDGWIGDASHAARPSEHNPCWTCTGYQRGIVRAIDVDVDDNDSTRDLRKLILNSAVGHRAVWYVISNGIIYSRTYGWAARRYTGTNGHFKHVHVSIQKTEAAARDTTLVLRQPGKTPPVGGGTPSSPPRDLTINSWCVQRLASRGEPVPDKCLGDNYQVMAFAAALDPRLDATNKALQLAVKGGDWARARTLQNYAVRVIQARAKLTQDGIFGPRTGAFMEKYGYTVQ